MLAKLFLGVYYNLSIWYKITGKTLWGALITLTGAAITIFLNVVWIPASPERYLSGYTGSAWATLACYSVMMVMAWAIGQRYYPVPYRLGKFFGYTGLSVFLYLVSSFLPSLSWLILVVLNAGLLGIFVAVVWFVERPLQTLRR
jgi:Na+-driven multidrug efflux pump